MSSGKARRYTQKSHFHSPKKATKNPHYQNKLFNTPNRSNSNSPPFLFTTCPSNTNLKAKLTGKRLKTSVLHDFQPSTPSEWHYHNLYGKEKIMGTWNKMPLLRVNVDSVSPPSRVMKSDSLNDGWHIRGLCGWDSGVRGMDSLLEVFCWKMCVDF